MFDPPLTHLKQWIYYHLTPLGRYEYHLRPNHYLPSTRDPKIRGPVECVHPPRPGERYEYRHPATTKYNDNGERYWECCEEPDAIYLHAPEG